MFNLIGNKKLKPFGLNITDRSIKIMQLARHKDGLKPVAFSSAEIPNNLITNHIITNEEKLSVLLSKAFANTRKLEGSYAVVSVPEAKSFVRILNLPKMDVSEIEGALPWELEQDIPVPIEQVYTDWRLVEETDDKMKVLAVASPKDYIDSLISVLRAAKIKPVAFELESQSTARASIAAEDKDKSILVVDMTSTSTTFSVVTKGVLEHTSSIAVGGNTLTEGISQALGINPKEAEKIKIDNGLLADTKKGNIRQAILPIIDNIVDEVRNVIKYHEDHSIFGIHVTKVVLCGGGAQLKGMIDYVTARLNVSAGDAVSRVVICDPWAAVAGPLVVAANPDGTPSDAAAARPGFPPQEESLEFTTAIGLAIRGVEIDEDH
jgi:type IV pilus assembly protein PilM